MPILDSIKAAEMKAEEVREKANVEVKALLDKTVKETNLKVEELYVNFNKEEVKLNNELDASLKKLEIEIDASCVKEEKSLEGMAQNNKGAVHKFIVEKVFEL